MDPFGVRYVLMAFVLMQSCFQLDVRAGYFSGDLGERWGGAEPDHLPGAYAALRVEVIEPAEGEGVALWVCGERGRGQACSVLSEFSLVKPLLLQK